MELVLFDCVFESFSLTMDTEYGAAIRISESISDTTPNDYISLLINGCEFLNNEATESGGVFHMQNHQFYANISDSMFSNNNAFAGGAFYIDATNDFILRTSNTTAPTYSYHFYNCTFDSNTADYQGGAIYLEYPSDFDYYWPHELTVSFPYSVLFCFLFCWVACCVCVCVIALICVLVSVRIRSC